MKYWKGCRCWQSSRFETLHGRLRKGEGQILGGVELKELDTTELLNNDEYGLQGLRNYKKMSHDNKKFKNY